jgi:hypothetical protein
MTNDEWARAAVRALLMRLLAQAHCGTEARSDARPTPRTG